MFPANRSRLFYSKSKDPQLKRLSNFYRVAEPFGVDQKLCQQYQLKPMEGSFDSVEAVYQAMKYVYAGGLYLVKHFTAGGKWSSPPLAKRFGGRKGMACNHLKLDMKAAWTSEVERNVMKMAVAARCTADRDYSAKLVQSAKEDFYWLHFERSGFKAKWGGAISSKTGEWEGRNLLGQIMREVGLERLNAATVS